MALEKKISLLRSATLNDSYICEALLRLSLQPPTSDALVHEYGETILGYFMHTKTPPAYGSVLVLLYRCEHFRKHGYRHKK